MPVESLIPRLRQDLTVMSEMVEQNVNSAIMALIERSRDMAQEVIDYDVQIDEAEVGIERRGLDALKMETSSSERVTFVVAAVKIANDLERISDLAVDIARNVQVLVEKSAIEADLSGFAEMLEFSSMMVRDSVISLLDKNVELAWRVCAHDDLVDEAYQALETQLHDLISKDSSKGVRAARLLVCALDLERIADHATSIAEVVIFMLEGKIVRHHIDEWRKRLAPELDKRRKRKRREL